MNDSEFSWGSMVFGSLKNNLKINMLFKTVIVI